MNHLKVATLLQQVELLDSLVLGLLVADVPADDCFVSPYGRDEVATRPEMLSNEVTLPIHERSRDVDRALALDEPDDVRDRVLRRDRDQHVDVI